MWRFLSTPNVRYPLGLLVGAGCIIGIALFGAFNGALALSNTETFCISCHEMRDTVYQELQGTIHWSNRTGVRATCPDCHVPKAWGHKVFRKVMATFNELPKHLLGVYDTKEKFEAVRPELAKDVWEDMKASDSRECRNCHHIDSMGLDKQRPRARVQHEDAASSGETCIDCHKGIAHKKFDTEGEEPAAEGGDSGGFTLQ